MHLVGARTAAITKVARLRAAGTFLAHPPRMATALLRNDTARRARWGRTALRLCLGTLFLGAGTSKFLAASAFATVLASCRPPIPVVLGTCASSLELVGGLLLIVAWRPRIVATVLAGYVIVASLLVHTPFTLGGPRGLELGIDALILLGLFMIARRSDSDRS